MIVEFIIPTYNRLPSLKMVLASLQAQTDDNWKASIIVDGKDHSAQVRDLIHELKDERITMKISLPRTNDWGHTPRELGKQASTGDYVIMTGDDNYYVPTLVEEVRKAARTNPGMIYWDMIHNHYDYQLFVCSPGFNQIDIGAFATRSDLAKQVHLNTSYAADGEFVEEFKQRFPTETILKIKKVLYVHN